MKLKKFFLSPMIGLTAAAICGYSAYSADVRSEYGSNIIPDVYEDGMIDSFDIAMASRNDLPNDTIKSLCDYVLGREYAPSGTDVVIDESCILEPKGTVHTGEGTFYGGGYEGGCAMLDPVSKDYWIVAMNLADYNDAQLAGAYLEVTGELGTINMLVTDLLPEGKKGDLDLYVDAFPLIAPAEKGRVPVSWKIIPLDTAENAPISYKYKKGTTEFWCGIQIRNHRYPITKLEYLDKNGEFQEIKRRPYNYFESDKMGKGPFTFRITDIYGQVIVDENIPLSNDDTEIIQGHVQLPK